MLDLISEIEKRIIFEIQDMPLDTAPFRVIAEKLGIPEDEVLKICRTLMDKGIIRRIAPSIAHRNMGFSANAMTAASIPDEDIDKVGMAVAGEDDVTHCYSREGWDHNLFFMVHGQTHEESISKVVDIAGKHGFSDYDIYFSITELKKTSFRLREEDLVGNMEAGQ